MAREPAKGSHEQEVEQVHDNSSLLRDALDAWLVRAEEIQDKATACRDDQYRAALRLHRMHFVVGIPAVVFSAIVASAVFATLQNSVSTAVAILVGVVGVTAAVLTALQTFLGFERRAADHRKASAGYDAIVEGSKDFATKYATLPAADKKSLQNAEAEVRRLSRRLTSLTDKSPGSGVILGTRSSGHSKLALPARSGDRSKGDLP